MKWDEFKRLIGADPELREPETRAARGDGPEYDDALRDAAAFEDRLRQTLLAPASDHLADELMRISERRLRPTASRWLALAASVVIGVVSVVAWLQTRPPLQVDTYLARHLEADGKQLVDRADHAVSPADMHSVLAKFGVAAGPTLARQVRLIKVCPTPDGRGAHMVVDSGAGLVHLIFMPETEVADGRTFVAAGYHARLVKLPLGAAIIAGRPGQPLERVDGWVRGSVRPLGQA